MSAKPSILARILDAKREEIARRRREHTSSRLRDRPSYHEARRGFRRALETCSRRAIIAEVKRASPSRGDIRPDVDAAKIASGYARAGAAAVSILTDEPFFKGTLEDLTAARQAMPLPLLRKDFVIDAFQVEEARAFGADALLLIVAATEATQRAELTAAAAEAGLDVLVETHDESELEVALAEGAKLVGINNRDLKTFVTSLETSERLLPRVPTSVVAVCESGITTANDMRRLEEKGAKAFLIGEALLEAADPSVRLAELLETSR